MYRSHLKLFVAILAICAGLLVPTALRAQPARPGPAAVAAVSPWSGLWQWVDDLVARFLPAPPAATVRTRSAPAQAAGSTGPSPGDWQCLDCADAGPFIDPDG